MIKCRAKRRRELLLKKKFRVRKKIKGTPERPRLSVRRTIKHMIVQLIDDVNQRSLLQFNTTIIKEKMTKKEKARLIGKMIGEKALSLGIKNVVFDRNGYRYHGRVKEVAEGAREAGLNF